MILTCFEKITTISVQAIIAKNTLISIIQSLPEGEFNNFINSNLHYSVKVHSMLKNGILVQQFNYNINISLYNLGKNSIVYMLFQNNTNNTINNIYIGSASNASNRIGQHYDTRS